MGASPLSCAARPCSFAHRASVDLLTDPLFVTVVAIGLIATAFVLRHWLSARFERYTPRPNTATAIIFGMIGGVTTMLANAGGPAWQMHLLSQRLEKLPYVGTVAILFAASNLIKV